MPYTVLVADDEAKIVSLVRSYLEASNFRVLGARDGGEALGILRSGAAVDCAVLDVNMPVIDGLELAREIRKGSGIPLIFLTARAEEADRVAGLELGADDYVTKPFSPRELVARVKAVLRRTAAKGETGTGPLTEGGLSLDPSKRTVARDGRPVELTAAQFDILDFLMRSPGRVRSRLEILEASSGTAYDGYERTVDAQIKNIRKALGDDAERPRFVETVRGVGYRFKEAPDEDQA